MATFYKTFENVE